MNREVMMMWIGRFLDRASNQQLRYIMNFIRGYLKIDQ